IIIMIFSAVLGNIIGSVLFEKIVVSMYYNSYDLTGYQSYFFPDVLIRTTIVPVVLLVIVLSFSLWKKLNMPTLKFLQNDLKKQTREKAMRLPRWSFIRRFRMRVIIENRSNYITLFIGILFAALLLIFGITSLPLLNNYSENAIKYKIAPYQYFLKNSVEVNTDKAEKFSAISLKSISDFFAAEDITVYGIRDDSRFYKGPELKKDEIVVSSDLSAKYHVGTGDTFTMKDPYSSKMYSFKVSGIFHQPSFICVYMRNKDFCKAFEKEIEDQMSADDALNMFITKLSGQTYDDYFNGYFSDIDLKNTYIDEENISIVITEVELTRVVRQMKISMGSIFQMFSVFSIVLCILLIYLLTKTVIEKSSLSIAMLKILGYKEAKIARVYIISGMIATAVSAVISLSLMYFLVGYMWIVFLKDYSGWFHFSCSLTDMAGMFLMIMGAYVIVSMILYRKIRRVPMGDVLKDVM
ncbi:MAG: FtsX-like permease family protein, partial [Lachnospiraceae bacterium]|nr:FtsX-like permease family protein [Lachnospiraceae bacterium]